jgi:hypothetical protein
MYGLLQENFKLINSHNSQVHESILDLHPFACNPDVLMQ